MGPIGLRGCPQSCARAANWLNHKRVAPLMRAHQIAEARSRPFKRTNTPARSAPKLAGPISGQSASGAPDQARMPDITYVRTGKGWRYQAAVLDPDGSRRLRCQMNERIDTRLVGNALDMTDAPPSPARDWPSQSVESALPRTMPWSSRTTPASNENSFTATATPTAQPRAGRSSNGPPVTSPTGATPASTAEHCHHHTAGNQPALPS